MTLGSSKCPAGVRRRAPSGLKVSRLKKLVKPSSPYSLTLAQDGVANGVRIAGSGGIGDGDRPKFLVDSAGELALVVEENEERRDLDTGPLSFGGFIAEAALMTDAVGVRGGRIAMSGLISLEETMGEGG